MNSPIPKPTGFSISAIAIRRHIGTLMLTLAIFVMGAFYINRLQVDLLPSIVYPRIGVQVNIPGITPEVAITEVTKPLEEALALTEGVNQLFSRTREGQVRVDLFFQAGSDVNQALNIFNKDCPVSPVGSNWAFRPARWQWLPHGATTSPRNHSPSENGRCHPQCSISRRYNPCSKSEGLDIHPALK